MRSIVFALLMLVASSGLAVDIAQCSNPSGKAYYPYLGMMKKENSGWTDDKITGGITTLSKIGENEYDILFVDSLKRIISSKQDGGKVLMLSRGTRDVSFLVLYPGKIVEVYTFLIDKSGKAEYIQVTSRGGDEVLIAKSTVMRGDCQFINFNLVN
jgi:hypothetical protein